MRLYEVDPLCSEPPWRTLDLPQNERVLHVHLETHIDPQKALVKALQGLGPSDYEILRWNPYDFHEKQYAGRQESLLRMAQRKKPTLVFMQLQQPGVIGPETIIRLKEAVPEATVVMWCGDIGRTNGPHVSSDSAWSFETARYLDLSLYTSMAQVRSHREHGMQNAAYLQIGYEDELFRPGPELDFVYDCVFFGQNYREVAWQSVPEHEIQLRRDAIKAMREMFGPRFGLFGQNWTDASMNMMRPDDTALAYRRSRSALSLSLVSSYEKYSSDRLHRAMACGTPTLVKRFVGCESWGLAEKNCFLWDTIDDLKYFAGNFNGAEAPMRDGEMRKIGMAGAKLMEQHHTWKVRMHELMVLVSAVRGKSSSRFKPTWG